MSSLLLLQRFFQSTLLQEERHNETVETINDIPFNPRSYKRSDNGVELKYYVTDLSIHAPTRGATATFNEEWFDYYLSIHAPTRGATRRRGF